MTYLIESGIILTYSLVGLLLMLIGYLVVDLLTPGKLHDLLWKERSINGAILVASNLVGVSIIVTGAIFASLDDFLPGLLSTFIFGLIGIAIMAISFALIDLLTPGKLGDIVHDPKMHPAVWVNASAHVGIAVVMLAAIL